MDAGMNWLAHLHLSGDSPATRIGNLLPDLLNAPELAAMPALFRGGIRLHHAIDSFTDRQEIFRRSASRIDGPMRRYRGILVDVFFDHFLAREWLSYSDRPLDEFVEEFHTSIDSLRADLPETAFVRLAAIRDGGYLLSYQDTGGIAIALERLGRRLRKPVDLGVGVTTLLERYTDFAADFREFYPLLADHVAAIPPPRTLLPPGNRG